MENQQSNLIPDPNTIIDYLGLGNLSDEEKTTVINELMTHLSDIVIETFSDNLNPDQANQLSAILDEPAAIQQEKLRTLASNIPGLHAKIEFTIQQELEILKQAYSKVN